MKDQCQLAVRETVYTLFWVILCQWTKEAEYKRISISEQNIIGVATTSAASTVEVTKRPSIPPVKKTVKNIVWCHTCLN